MRRDSYGSANTDTTSRGTGHNLFFGLFPDPATQARMGHAVGELRAGASIPGRWLTPARYHMTLHFLGSYPALPLERVAAAGKAAGQLAVPPFEVILDRAGHFSHGIGWLGCTRAGTHLQALWEQLRQALARAGIEPGGHARFIPHVTVLRDARKPLAPQPITPIVWQVRELVLIDSVLGAHGEYRPLGRWDLGS